MIQHLNNELVAPINEVFFSYQGEGIYAGLPQIFVRFEGCNLRCNYCDTTKALKVNTNAKYVTQQDLIKEIVNIYKQNKKKFFNQIPSISFTGGEPLIYSNFLKNVLKELKKKHFSVYIETNGTLVDNLKQIVSLCDVVSMDIKFKSACNKELSNVHEDFMSVCKNKVFVKTVITKDTTKKEFFKAVKIIQAVSNKINLIIQPSGFDANINAKVFEFYSIALNSNLKDVRILPQLHKLWEIQ